MMNLLYTYQPLFDYFLLAVGFAYSQQMVLRAGVFSIGSAGFACIGAYAVGILVKNQGFHPLVALPIATLVGCLGGLLLSIPLARLRGVFQAIATLAFVQIIVSLCLYFDEITGGPQGFNNIPKLVGTEHLVLAVAVTVYFMYVISRSSIGRAFDALRQDETVGATLGISIRKYHMIAFILSGALAGFFGGMQSLYTYSIEPEMFGFAFLVAALTYIILGGRGTVTGPIIGAAIMSLLPELARPAGRQPAVLPGCADDGHGGLHAARCVRRFCPLHAQAAGRRARSPIQGGQPCRLWFSVMSPSASAACWRCPTSTCRCRRAGSPG